MARIRLMISRLKILAQGMVVLTASAWVPGLTPGPEDGPAKWWQGAFLFGALYIVALGTGGALTPDITTLLAG